MSNENKRRGPMGGHGPMGGMVVGEKAKDFKGTVRKLLNEMGVFKYALIGAILFAIASSAFSIIGPKILGNATTEIFEGLMKKVSGNGGIDYDRIAYILLMLIGLYIISLIFSFIQGVLMSNISQKMCYNLRKKLCEKVNRMPMKYFDKKTHRSESVV